MTSSVLLKCCSCVVLVLSTNLQQEFLIIVSSINYKVDYQKLRNFSRFSWILNTSWSYTYIYIIILYVGSTILDNFVSSIVCVDLLDLHAFPFVFDFPFVYKNPWIPWYQTRTLREHLSVYLLHYLSSLLFPQPSISFSLSLTEELNIPVFIESFPSLIWKIVFSLPQSSFLLFEQTIYFYLAWEIEEKKGEDEIKLAVKRCKKLQNNIC